ncbi:hypothetical protein OF83DRAFT_1142098 [Amylostereum chailletii]|nr:hypothetical protein OF83DRAFT_1142098 [Amylostereum chailletii]
MDSPVEKAPSDFGPPFDDADADLTLRSSDVVDFHVDKRVVFKVSLRLKESIEALTMVSAGTDSSITPTRVVLLLPESSKVLSTLLSTILPVPIQYPGSFEEMAAVLSASKKYGIAASSSIISELIRANRYDGPPPPWSIGSVDPFQAYYIACRYGLEEEAALSARLGCNRSLSIEQCVGPELVYVSGPELYALWSYHKDTVKLMRKTVRSFCSDPEIRKLWITETACRGDIVHGIPDWLSAFIQKAVESFSIDDATTFHQTLSDHALRSKCNHCRTIPSHVVRRFREELNKAVTKARDKVRFRSKNLGRSPRSLLHSNRPPIAPLPTFARPDADIILRSSNGVDFSVYKSTLALASPVFEDMLSLPLLPADGSNKPSVSMEEDAYTLNVLLSMIYPAPVIVPATIEDAILVFAAAQKYDMDSTSSLLKALFYKGDMQRNHITIDNAYRIYGLASEFNLRDEAAQAARLTLHLPMTFDVIGADLYAISGRALYTLWKYRTAYLKASLDGLSNTLQPAYGSICRMYTVGPCIMSTRDTRRHYSLPPVWLRSLEELAARFSDATQPIPQIYTLCVELWNTIHPLPRVRPGSPLPSEFTECACKSCRRIFAGKGIPIAINREFRMPKVRVCAANLVSMG